MNKGLCESDIQKILEFDWDKSSDEECVDDESEFLEDGLKDIDKGEEFKIGILESIANQESIEPENTQSFVFEKVDLSKLKWRKKPFDFNDVAWKGHVDNVDIVNKPIQYFNSFFDDAVIDLIVKETNLYALQASGCELKCNKEDIRRYIGVLLYMGVVQLPNFKMAWSQELKLTAITNAMPRNKFEKIKKFLHFSDKSKQPTKNDANYDKLYKIFNIY